MEVSFQKKTTFWLIYCDAFFSLLDGFVDETVDSQVNYQEYRYDVYFLRRCTFAVIHSANGEGVCQIIITTIFDMSILSHI